MDPFEVRIRFTQQLASLNASVTGASKTAQYALKYRDLDEDLHSCILEQLERSGNSMNNRANIMYFIEHLCDMAARENHYDYIRMMQRDILRMVDAVAPEDGSGAANVKVVRKVLQALQTKSFLLAQTVSEIEELLKERDTLPDNIGLSSPIDPSTPLAPSSSSKSKMSAPQRLDKKQIETRIEEDRERHKRLRENIWAIPKAAPGNSFNGGLPGVGDEFDKLWDETSDLGEDDLELYREEGEERGKASEGWSEEFAKMHAPAE
ncbi:CTD kinase subunit gamma CTK3-domain-containing protein [Rhexocercosporidium sp. MPI-PUGE-AT-0058]|nr:CTD kinase subunit gamma CTK3-domain-containing protein [Rhexocercosporidium sp. MPI-PUGE-AT-0058]